MSPYECKVLLRSSNGCIIIYIYIYMIWYFGWNMLHCYTIPEDSGINLNAQFFMFHRSLTNHQEKQKIGIWFFPNRLHHQHVSSKFLKRIFGMYSKLNKAIVFFSTAFSLIGSFDGSCVLLRSWIFVSPMDWVDQTPTAQRLGIFAELTRCMRGVWIIGDSHNPTWFLQRLLVVVQLDWDLWRIAVQC